MVRAGGPAWPVCPSQPQTLGPSWPGHSAGERCPRGADRAFAWRHLCSGRGEPRAGQQPPGSCTAWATVDPSMSKARPFPSLGLCFPVQSVEMVSENEGLPALPPRLHVWEVPSHSTSAPSSPEQGCLAGAGAPQAGPGPPRGERMKEGPALQVPPKSFSTHVSGVAGAMCQTEKLRQK